ncbi:MAG: VanW family protein [Clostridiales bacterium]|nr:VanW family protein [Clostridiales bacterium]
MERRPRKGGRQERRKELELENGSVLYGKEIERMAPPQGKQDDDSVRTYDGRTIRMPVQPVEKPIKKHDSLFWALLVLVNLILLFSLFLFLSPQILGLRFRSLPNYAFINMEVIEMDEERMAEYVGKASSVYMDVIHQGISIDGVDVSGLTVDQARAKLMQVPATIGSEFAITVDVDGTQWVIDSNRVPMTRDIEDQLTKAYAMGRGIQADTSGTPMEQQFLAIEQLKREPVELKTTLSFDREQIHDLARQIADQVEKPAQNAFVSAFDPQTKTFLFGDDLPGRHLDADRLYAAVMARLEGGDYYGSVSFQTDTVIAEVTKTELINSFRMISSYSTKTTDDRNRNTNIDLSCKALNGIMVPAGETFSFNQATGERTPAKGYKPATAISGGENIEEVGGGVCQTSSTLFNAVARADLEIVSRSPHAWPSKYVEKGMDATVNWPGLDFKFRNSSEWPVYIVASYANRKVTVEIYGMSIGDGTSIDLESKVTRKIDAPSGVKEVFNEKLAPGTRKTTVKARNGYEVETYKVWFQNGREIKRELLCKSTYKAYQETVEYH